MQDRRRSTRRKTEDKAAGTGSSSSSKKISRRRCSSSDKVSLKRCSSSDKVSVTTKKRSRTASVERPHKVQKRMVDGRRVDLYCWICHKLAEDFICEFCPRVYHNNCLKKLKKDPNQLPCECHFKTVDARNEDLLLNPSELKELLQCAMQEAIKDGKKNTQRPQRVENNYFCKYLKTWPEDPDNEKGLCQIIDLDILIDKMNDITPYSSTGQFFLDVKWIYHNCFILHGAKNAMTEAALKLEKNFKNELTDMEACTECYRNKHSGGYMHADFFTKVCRVRHPIIWAKMKFSPFWPAKCLKIHNGHVDVRFFGTHDKTNVLINQCFKMSRTAPFQRKIRKPKYQDAITELSVYVSNYENVAHCPFPYSEVETPLQDSSSKKHKGKQKEQASRNNNLSDTVETKVNAVHPVIASVNGDSQDVTESTENVSNPNTDVVCHMTFTAEQNGPESEEMMNSDEFLDNFTSRCSLSQVLSEPNMSSSQNETPDVHSKTSVLPSSSELGTNTEVVQNNSVIFFNVNDSSSLPVITSAVSACENAEYASKVNENSLSSEMSMNDFHGSSASALLHVSPVDNNQIIDLMTQCRNPFDGEDDGDEEIQVVNEDLKKKLKSETMLKNPAVIKAFCELLLSTKPHLREHYRSMQAFYLRTFMMMWLEGSQQDANEFRKFIDLYGKAQKKIDYLQVDKSHLRQEVVELKSRIVEMEAKNDKRNSLRKDIAEATKGKIQAIEKEKNEIQLNSRKLEEKVKNLIQENEALNAQLVECKQKMDLNENEHNESKAQLKLLTKYLDNINKKEGSSHGSSVPACSKDTFQNQNSDCLHENVTHTNVQQSSMVIIQQSMSSLPATNSMNAGVVQQVYESNVLLSEHSTMMTAPSPTLVQVPVVVTAPLVEPHSPIFLDSASSATFLNEQSSLKSRGISSENSSKLRSTNSGSSPKKLRGTARIPTKTSRKRKKDNF